MNISVLKKMRRDLCKTVGHSYIKGLCSRCKKRIHVNTAWTVSSASFVGKMPVRKDIPVQVIEPVGNVVFNIDTNKMMFYDGKNWIECE